MKVKELTYVSTYIALALVLEYVSKLIPILQMPQGGSINLAVIPVFIASYHLGFKKGVLVGILWWLIGFLLGGNNWYLNPMQYSLDYIVPMSIIGFACCIPNVYASVTVIGIIRFLSTFISGIYFWPPDNAVAGSMSAILYSFNYNVGYNLGTVIVAIVLVPLLMKALKNLKLQFSH